MIDRDKLTSNFEKIYRNGKFLHPYKYGLNNFPFYIDLEATNACNLNCIMCNRQLMTRKIGFMDFGIFEKVVDEMAEFAKPVGLRFVRHGEPTLHKRLTDMIAYAHKKNILTFLSTNGLIFTEDMVVDLLNSGLDEVRFSMQGTDRQEYLKIRCQDTYETFENNIALFRKKRNLHKNETAISLCTSVTDETQDQIQ